MQATLRIAPSSLFPLPSTKQPALRQRTLPLPVRCPLPLKVSATVPNDTSSVDYSSTISVFPAEACETIGGAACNVEMYPEAKLKPEARNNMPTGSEQVDREYLDYDGPNTVFLEEACDDLGGEFCRADNQ